MRKKKCKIVHNITWLDLCLAVAKGRTVPKKIRYVLSDKSEKILSYDSSRNEYKSENGRVYSPLLSQLNDKVEILEK